ncbi:SHOCT domain-containing protein [Streptomyces sioyaensis]|uniref:SHOCT domain-containing protein n=1 Tax=Streptomyces sioyaensis TaxID=67364 RepID=A0A4V1NRA3_9ACTN|nr:SHOCT domain-containing protein [Streptomyces sioyaensis]RXS71119.1 SHOCT domain-containing protein [Streptomyces sioyaensis]
METVGRGSGPMRPEPHARAGCEPESERGVPVSDQDYEQERQGGEADAGPPATDPPDDMSIKIAQLKKLTELKDQGVLTDAEFQAEKRKLLES